MAGTGHSMGPERLLEKWNRNYVSIAFDCSGMETISNEEQVTWTLLKLSRCCLDFFDPVKNAFWAGPSFIGNKR